MERLRTTGELIATTRRDRNLSQRQLAALAGVSHTQVARYEAGAEPTLPVAHRLASALGLSLDELATPAPEAA